MEEYKQYLLSMIEASDIIELKEMVKHNIKLHYMQEDLNSEYVDGRYKPAVIFDDNYGNGYYKRYFWLFDGDIKDCDHPFYIQTGENDEIICIMYYSTDRIKNSKPIKISSISSCFTWCVYNCYSSVDKKILEEYDYETDYVDFSIHELAEIEQGQISPLCEEFAEELSFKFKFAD